MKPRYAKAGPKDMVDSLWSGVFHLRNLHDEVLRSGNRFGRRHGLLRLFLPFHDYYEGGASAGSRAAARPATGDPAHGLP